MLILLRYTTIIPPTPHINLRRSKYRQYICLKYKGAAPESLFMLIRKMQQCCPRLHSRIPASEELVTHLKNAKSVLPVPDDVLEDFKHDWLKSSLSFQKPEPSKL